MKILYVGCLALAAVSLSAAEVGDLTTFTAGTPAKAAEVNDNFNKVKTAVNDNYTRLTAAETQAAATANSLTTFRNSLADNTCPEGSAIRSIDSNGVTVCQNVSPYSVMRWSPHDFHQEDERNFAQCTLDRDPALVVYGSNTICTVYAPVHIPHGMRVNSMECVAHDTLAGGDGEGIVRVKMQRREYGTGVLYDVFDTGPTTLNTGSQLLTDSTALNGSSIIDNLNNVYRLSVQFAGLPGVSLLSSNTGSIKLALSNCGIDFQPQ